MQLSLVTFRFATGIFSPLDRVSLGSFPISCQYMNGRKFLLITWLTGPSSVPSGVEGQ